MSTAIDKVGIDRPHGPRDDIQFEVSQSATLDYSLLIVRQPHQTLLPTHRPPRSLKPTGPAHWVSVSPPISRLVMPTEPFFYFHPFPCAHIHAGLCPAGPSSHPCLCAHTIRTRPLIHDRSCWPSPYFSPSLSIHALAFAPSAHFPRIRIRSLMRTRPFSWHISMHSLAPPPLAHVRASTLSCPSLSPISPCATLFSRVRTQAPAQPKLSPNPFPSIALQPHRPHTYTHPCSLNRTGALQFSSSMSIHSLAPAHVRSRPRIQLRSTLKSIFPSHISTLSLSPIPSAHVRAAHSLNPSICALTLVHAHRNPPPAYFPPCARSQFAQPHDPRIHARS